MTGALLALLLAQAIGNTSPPGVVVHDEGVAQGRARTLNCVGAGIACSVSAGVGTLTIAGGGGSTTITQVTVDLGTQALPSFTATITDGSVTGTSKIVAVQDGGAIPGAISFTANGGQANCTAATTCPVTVTSAAGTYNVVGFNYFVASQRGTSVVDDASIPNTYTLLSFATNATNSQELWIAKVASPPTTVTVNLSAGTTLDAFVANYASVVQYQAAGTATGTSAAPSLSAIVGANDFLVTNVRSQSGTTMTGTLGTVRYTGALLSGTGIIDNTSASAGTVTTTANVTSSVAWAVGGVWLMSGDKTADENELDPFTCNASPAAGSFILNCTAVGTLLTGRYRINYLFQ